MTARTFTGTWTPFGHWEPVVLQFPSTPIELQYFVEGSANILYRIRPRINPPSPAPSTPPSELEIYHDASSTPPPPTKIVTAIPYLGPEFTNKLLRVRKAFHTLHFVRITHEHYEKFMKPMFDPDEIVEQTLVALPRSWVDSLNATLLGMDMKGQRNPKWRGTYLDTEEGLGLVVEDMSPSGYPGDPRNVFCMKFKPGWLVQSGSAPTKAKRCHTCALRAMRFSRGEFGTNIGGEAFCPLKLMSKDKEVVFDTIFGMLLRGILPGVGEKGWPPVAAKIINRLDKPPGNGLLHRLKAMQIYHDREGILNTVAMSLRFLTSRTLKDCTLFLRVELSEDGRIEMKVGDLDLKSAKKAHEWKAEEHTLIDEGWYMLPADPFSESGVICALSGVDKFSNFQRCVIQTELYGPR